MSILSIHHLTLQYLPSSLHLHQYPSRKNISKYQNGTSPSLPRLPLPLRRAHKPHLHTQSPINRPITTTAIAPFLLRPQPPPPLSLSLSQRASNPLIHHHHPPPTSPLPSSNPPSPPPPPTTSPPSQPVPLIRTVNLREEHTSRRHHPYTPSDSTSYPKDQNVRK